MERTWGQKENRLYRLDVTPSPPPPGLSLILYFLQLSSQTHEQIWFRMIVKKIKRYILGHDLYACYENPDRVKVHLRQSTLTAMCHGPANQKPYAHVEKYQCTNKKMTVELIVSWGVKWKIVCGTKCAMPPLPCAEKVPSTTYH